MKYIAPRINLRLSHFPAAEFLAPRQMGKTIPARVLGPRGHGGKVPDYLDRENPTDRENLEDAREYLTSRSDQRAIIDAVQRGPGHFEVLGGIIDD